MGYKTFLLLMVRSSVFRKFLLRTERKGPESIKLRWAIPSGLINGRYLIRYREIGTKEYVETYAEGNNYTIYGLKPGTTYEFQLQILHEEQENLREWSKIKCERTTLR